jgi:integrase
MLWEYIPLERNPMELIRIKGSTKRQKYIVAITPEQFRQIVDLLPEPYNLMVMLCGYLGLRVSETLALKWSDFNWESGTVSIQRAFTHGQLQEATKSDTSGADLPVYPGLAEAPQRWQTRQQHDFAFVFANPRTASPYSDSTILTNYLKPAARQIGLERIGWHTFRHSYKSWLSSAKATGSEPSN